MVDVQDFINGGDVSVKTLDEVEIVVEGRVQRKVGNTTSTKSFKRTFILPDIVPESITSVVSSDGVLIIKALKKVGSLSVVPGTLVCQYISTGELPKPSYTENLPSFIRRQGGMIQLRAILRLYNCICYYDYDRC